jgi:hypothetical protein
MQTTASAIPSENGQVQEQPSKKENPRVIHNTPSAKAAHSRKPEKAVKHAASKPTKFLPSERITFSRQLDILRGWAAASGPLRKVVTNNDCAKIVEMQPSTVSMNNAFCSSIGLLIKAEGGYMPAEEVTAFLRAYDWNKETAVQKLAPVLSRSWFYEALASKLEFGPRSEADCLQDLGDAANANQDYRLNLRVLLEYLANAGLIQRDGDMIKKGSVNMAPSAASAPPSAEPVATKQESGIIVETGKMAPSLFGTTEGEVQFNVVVKVKMGEFSTWPADRIASFFNGIAQVLAAKAKMEQSE